MRSGLMEGAVMNIEELVRDIRDTRAEIDNLKSRCGRAGENKKLQLWLKELQYFYL